ncbi:hypothetical protein [Kineococcus terrestris]|uniref:hypothetical protein n=1 Tax=Kineococcus terrestris TaxID=2044856 RepID=UPI0034DB5103
MTNISEAAGPRQEPAAPHTHNTARNGRSQGNSLGRRNALANMDPWFADCIERGIKHLARTGHQFNVDSLRELGIPEPDVAQRWGAAFAAAAAHGVIEVCGAGIVWRPSGTSVPTRMWRGTNDFRGKDQRGAA